MLWFKNTSDKNINLLLGILCISFALFSCEADEVNPIVTSISFELPDVVSVNENVDLKLKAEGDYDAIEWIISDGSKYNSPETEHQFSKSGNYYVEAKTYLNGIQTSSLIKEIEVYYSSKTISLSTPVFAQGVYYAENKIIIQAKSEDSQAKETLPCYLIIDKDLNLLSEIKNPEDIDNELESTYILGDSVLAINSNIDNSQLFFQYKSTNSQTQANTESSAFINYTSGFIYKRNEGLNGFFIDYYNESNEKIWTKSFEDGGVSGSKYVFNINNRLFYLSFDCNANNIYIEKFKNPSVVFKNNLINLQNSDSPTEMLFAFNNASSSSIEFAIYNSEADITNIYRINEECALEDITSINGLLEGKPQFCTNNGAIILTDNYRITKYNADWSINTSKNLNNSDFGICPIGDNLNLLYENLPSGNIRLSYLDKHLNSVLFE